MNQKPTEAFTKLSKTSLVTTVVETGALHIAYWDAEVRKDREEVRKFVPLAKEQRNRRRKAVNATCVFGGWDFAVRCIFGSGNVIIGCIFGGWDVVVECISEFMNAVIACIFVALDK